jgi:hypothetical protein
VVDLTDDDGKPSSTNVADSREVTFNKLSGKTFPSLVVVARPHLRIKDMAQGTVSQERAALGEFFGDVYIKVTALISSICFCLQLHNQEAIKRVIAVSTTRPFSNYMVSVFV